MTADGPSPASGALQTRLLFVDDHAAIREALAAAFDAHDDFRVVAQVGTCEEAMPHLRRVDVVVLDLRLPDACGSTLIPQLRRVNRSAQALVLTSADDRASLALAVERGASAVLSKSLRLQAVVDAVRALRAGKALLPETEVFALMREASARRRREAEDRSALAELTPREIEVLGELVKGLNGHEIAALLGISVRTQRNHVANVLAKLGVHSQLQAVLMALRYEVVSMDGETVRRP